VLWQNALYAVCMANSGELKVSSRGQMSLPALPRRRWGLEAGGEVGYLDLGDAVVIVPGGAAALRRSLLERISDADWRAAHGGFGDPDLATE
jgi:bifunctional DNA-binding transcriptional regulator/antitoxin component of YhaV-PrlF toxin-antitoxin module